LRADKLITSGQDIGPLPAPTPTGEKRRYQYNQQREFHRPLAPSVDSTEVDDSPKLQPTKIQPPARFKQEQARFTTQPTSDQGLEQVSLQLQLQGRKSLENQPTIIPQNHIQQQILGPHLGTFNPEERHRAHFSTRDTVKEKEQREMQIRQQMHEVQQAQQEKEHIQRHQDREGHAHHRNTLSQHQNEQSAQSFQQHAPNLIPNALQSTLVGQQPTSAAQAGAAPAPVVEFRYDDKVEAYLKSQGQQQQQQIIQQQQATQQTRLQQQLQQRQTQIDTSSSMRRFGSSAYGNALSQNHSPASASLPPMSPPGETLRPRSVPVNASIQPPPPGPPKKSSIMDLLNNDAPDPPPRKRLNDQQRPAAPTPPPQQPTYQAGAQQMQPQIQRRDTPTDSVVHMQQQHRPPSFSQPNQHQQQIPPPPPPRERAPNWASAAQHLQQRPYLDERSAQAQVISPQSQPSFLPPNSARNSIQALQQQRSHVSTPPPFGQHSRNPSYASVQQIQQHQQLQHQHQHHHHYQQQQSLPSTPAEPNIRPSPYASLNPSQPPQQQQQPQTPLQQRLEMQQREAILMQQQEHAQQQQQHQQYRMQQQQEQEHARRQGRLTFEQEIIQQDLQREFEMRQQQQAIRDHELAGRREMEERERERGRFPATFFGGDLQRR